MTSWIRVCSNGAGNPLIKKERFVLYSGKGFYKSYGFQPTKDITSGIPSNQQIIGYTPEFFGQPHIIENSLVSPSITEGEFSGNWPIHVPPPEISRLEVIIQKELFRRATIEWVCFSWKQLVYMTPYFLVPGITCMVEWGWNHFNPQSLVNLGDRDLMRKLWDNAYPLYTDNILKSNGNYDVVYGIVSNFDWSMEGNKIICSTEITSKDRLYSGIAKDYGLSVKDNEDGTSGGIFKSLKTFISNDDTIKNLKNIVSSIDVKLPDGKTIVSTQPITTTKNISDSKTNSMNTMKTWSAIIEPLLNIGTPEQRFMQWAWVFGIFSGRPKNSYTENENFGVPFENDFDKKIQDNDPNRFWINMGMVVAILNYFSARPSGSKNGKNMFKVDIQNSIISGHPNLISCDSRVLIPNYQAPKFHYGDVGLFSNADKTDASKGFYTPQKNVPYTYQVLRFTPVGDSKPNQFLQKTFFQNVKNPQKLSVKCCLRDNLDSIINYNRYRVLKPSLNYFSFPSVVDMGDNPFPDSINDLKGNSLEQNYSGLLSNIYISFSLLKDAVENESNVSYVDIYKYILNVLMSSVDGFWDLQLIDVDGTITITDKNFIGSYALRNQQDKVYSFDYYDSDSIIKSIKFKPSLSDAQATRTMYGKVNNKNSKFVTIDKNDLLDYQFKDSIILTEEDQSQNEQQGDLERRKSAQDELRAMVGNVQCINQPSDDDSLQMSLNPYRKGVSPPQPPYNQADMPEIIKLILPEQQLLRLLLNDDDHDNNPRYCAVQPGIILELCILGLGGLRTFQYFLVKNLPPPYSDENVIFRITDVKQSIESGNWETTIQAQLSPLRGYIKKRVRGPDDSQPSGWKIIN